MNTASPLALLTEALTLARTFSTGSEATADTAILTLFRDHDARRAACVLALALTILNPPDTTTPTPS